MSYKNSLIRRIVKEFSATIERMRHEYDPSYGELIGALELIKHAVLDEIDSIRYLEIDQEEERKSNEEIEDLMSGKGSDDEDYHPSIIPIEDVASLKSIPNPIASPYNEEIEYGSGKDFYSEGDKVVSIQNEIIVALEEEVMLKDDIIKNLEIIIKELSSDGLE